MHLRLIISIHALREEGDGHRAKSSCTERYFYPRPPRGGRRRPLCPVWPRRGISIHALREEGDLFSELQTGRGEIFLSTPSARRATDKMRLIREAFKFLSTPSARRATGRFLAEESESKNFYPRPPRGGRLERKIEQHERKHFYPRPPRGGRLISRAPMWLPPIFLSTPSARRATAVVWPHPVSVMHFYPRPPRGGRPAIGVETHRQVTEFLSTPSARRATWPHRDRLGRVDDFYPRPPRGGRRRHRVRDTQGVQFLSTPSARRATMKARFPQAVDVVFLSTPSARRMCRASGS